MDSSFLYVGLYAPIFCLKTWRYIKIKVDNNKTDKGELFHFLPRHNSRQELKKIKKVCSLSLIYLWEAVIFFRALYYWYLAVQGIPAIVILIFHISFWKWSLFFCIAWLWLWRSNCWLSVFLKLCRLINLNRSPFLEVLFGSKWF